MLSILAAAAVALTPVKAEPMDAMKAQGVLAYTLGMCWFSDPEPNTDARMKRDLPGPLYDLYEKGKADPNKPKTYAVCRALIQDATEAVDRASKSAAR